MKFYGREKELQALKIAQEGAKKGPARMTVVTGRRRVGKTTLIRKSVAGEPSVYCFVSANSEAVLCDHFAKIASEQLGEYIPGGYKSFSKLFETLMLIGQRKSFTLIIDEFQEFFRINSSIYSEMQDVWDRNKDESRIHVILSGSVHSLMKRIFEDNREPLFGRATTKIFLKPFQIEEIKSLFKEYSPNSCNEDLLALYMFTGGVPFYMADFIDNSVYTKDAMIDWIVRPGSLFINEGRTLLSMELGKKSAQYFSILSFMARGETNASRISDQMNAGVLSSYFDRLETEYELIEKLRPVLSKLNTKAVRYVLKDPFLKFWFRFIFRNQDLIELGQSEIIADEIRNNYETYSGLMLERYFRQKLFETGKYIEVGSWWNQKRGIDNKQDEIDIVAVERDKAAVLVAEVKRQRKSFREFEFLNKVEHLKTLGLNKMAVETKCLTLENM